MDAFPASVFDTAMVVVRVSRAEYFGAIPAESARVRFQARTPATSVFPDSVLTDSLGRAAAQIAFGGDSAIVDAEAFVGALEANGSPIAICLTRP